MSVFDFGRGGTLVIDQKARALRIVPEDDRYCGELDREEALQLARLILHLLGGEPLEKPQSFGRFRYFPGFQGCAHYWSTCEPPLYGARMVFDAEGDLQFSVSGDDGQVPPTADELQRAQAMLRPLELPPTTVEVFGPEGPIDSEAALLNSALKMNASNTKRFGWLKRKASEIVSRHIYRVVLRRMEKGKTG